MTRRSTYSDNADFWIRIIREELDPYRTQLTDAAVLNAVDAGPGVDVLDAGCGEGYLARKLARLGAQVTGVDSCDELVRAARALPRGTTITYLCTSVSRLPLHDAAYDVVLANHLINDLPEVSTPFLEFRRVLRAGGRLVILMLHPCFYVPHAERSTVTGVMAPAEYFSRRMVEQPFSVAGMRSPAPVRMWFHPLEYYISALSQAGFVVSELSEPHLAMTTGWWAENFRRPMFLLLTATAR